MSIEKLSNPQAPTPVQSPLTMKELATVLVKHYNLTEGKFDLLVEFQFAAGQFGIDPASLSPAMMVGISKLGLIPSVQDGPNTVDASTVNAKRTARKTLKR
jgi:hypothetical protein